MPNREIIRVDTERQGDDLTLPSDCIVRPTDGRKPFIVRERHLMMPAIEQTSTNPSTLTLYRGDHAPQFQDILIERRNGVVYSISTQSYTPARLEVDDDQTPFITTVRFKEELRSIPQAVVASTNSASASVAGPSVAPPPQGPSVFSQATNESTYFTFNQATTMPIAPPAVPQPPPVPAPAAAQGPLPPPAAPFAAVGAPHTLSISSSTSQRRSGLFGAFGRFFGPDTPPVEYWQHYQNVPYVGTKRKWCDGGLRDGLASKRLRQTLLAGGVAVVVASALSKGGVIQTDALPWKPIQNITSVETPWL